MLFRALLVSSWVLAVSLPVHAQDPDAEATRCIDFGTDDAEVQARIADIRARIAHHEPDTRHWFTAWSTVFGTLLGVELTIAFTAANDGARIDAAVSTLSVGLGLITQLIAFPPLFGAGGQLDAMPESTPDERLRKLVAAEHVLRRAADAVRFARGPIGPVLSGLYSTAANAVLIIAFGRTVAAYIGVIGGLILGQGRILSAPGGIDHEWRSYQRAHADAGCAIGTAPSTPLSWQLTPSGSSSGGGLSFQLTF